MAIFRNYSGGLLKLCVYMLIILCAPLTCKVYCGFLLSNLSVKGFIFEQFCFTTRQFPYLIMHGTMRNNSFDGFLECSKTREVLNLKCCL